MVLTSAQKSKAYRQRQKDLLGRDAFRIKQNKLRNDRRKAAKLRNVAANVAANRLPRPTIRAQRPPKPTIKAPPPPYPKSKPPPIPAKYAKNGLSGIVDMIYQIKLKKLSSQKKSIKKTSVQQQFNKVVNIYKAMNDKPMKSLKWLVKTGDVIKFIKNNDKWKTNESKNSQLQAISGIIGAVPSMGEYYKIYSAASTAGRKKITKITDKNLLSDSEKKNIVKWGEIDNIMDTSNVVKNMKPFDKALIGFYTLLPPRRVESVALLQLATAKTAMDPTKNYIIVNKNMKPVKLIYNVYKTFKYHGVQTIVIPKKLANILHDYIKHAKLTFGDSLFGDVVNFSEKISQVFGRYIKKKITANALRRAFISDYLSKPRSIAARKNIASLMGNSIDVQQKYLRLELTS
jgi:hypothetical protein